MEFFQYLKMRFIYQEYNKEKYHAGYTSDFNTWTFKKNLMIVRNTSNLKNQNFGARKMAEYD